MIYDALMEADDMVPAWLIQRQDHPAEWLHVRSGRYMEWTTVKNDALQFMRAQDARAFAEFYFGSATHGHDIVMASS